MQKLFLLGINKNESLKNCIKAAKTYQIENKNFIKKKYISV